MDVLLIGAGGHGRVVADALRAAGHRISAYADPRPSAWLDAVQLNDDQALATAAGHPVAVGLGGVRPEDLESRLAIVHRLVAARAGLAPVIHPAATVSADAVLGAGTVVMAGAVIQSGARLGMAVIVNTGAVVEHDAEIADGAHVAPRATVLGGAQVGACAMIGAGAVVLPGARVPAASLVPALTRYPT